MSGQSHQNEITKRLLLGELSDEEQIALEKRFFEDDAVFEQLKIAEEELIESYLDDRLDGRDRASFEQRLVRSSRLRERVIFAKILAAKVDKQALSITPVPVPAPTWSERFFGSWIFQRPAFNMVLVAALLIIVLGSIAWYVKKAREAERYEANKRLEQQQQEQQRQQQEQATVPGTQTPTPAPVPTETSLKTFDPARLALITLTPGASRSTGSSGNVLTLDAAKEKIRLTLIVDDTSYERYNVRFRGNLSKKSFQKEGRLKKATSELIVEVQAAELPTDDYLIKVNGIMSSGTEETVSEYTLNVRRK